MARWWRECAAASSLSWAWLKSLPQERRDYLPVVFLPLRLYAQVLTPAVHEFVENSLSVCSSWLKHYSDILLAEQSRIAPDKIDRIFQCADICPPLAALRGSVLALEEELGLDSASDSLFWLEGLRVGGTKVHLSIPTVFIRVASAYPSRIRWRFFSPAPSLSCLILLATRPRGFFSALFAHL